MIGWAIVKLMRQTGNFIFAGTCTNDFQTNKICLEKGWRSRNWVVYWVPNNKLQSNLY